MGSGNVFQSFVDEHNWNGEFEDADPFFGVQIGDLEDGWEWWNVEDHEVKTQREEEGSHKPDVQPWRHSDDRLVFGNTKKKLFVKKLKKAHKSVQLIHSKHLLTCSKRSTIQ